MLMPDELRLVSIGWPLEDAITFCYAMRREQEDLEAFIAAEESKARGNNAVYVLQPESSPKECRRLHDTGHC